ncbi:hypothetical protein OW764_11610 [Klebsiella pneumoniae]
MAPRIKTHDNRNVMNYLKGKSYNGRTQKKIKGIIESVTDKEQFHNAKGGNSLYLFEALKRVPDLTNTEVGKCINDFRLEILLNQLRGKLEHTGIQYINSNRYDPEGFVNIQFLKHYSSDFEEFELLGSTSIKNYGKAAREASKLLEMKINVPVLDDSIKQYLDDLIKSGIDKKLIIDYLKNKKT